MNNNSRATGDISPQNNTKVLNCKVGDYNVAVKVNENNQFMGIETISVDKIFYDYRSVKGEHDVAQYYQE